MSLRALAVRIVGGVWIAVACGGRSGPPAAPGGGGETPASHAAEGAPGIDLRLSEGTPGSTAPDTAGERTSPASATRLGDAAVEAISQGAPPPAVDVVGAPVALRPGPLLPPPGQASRAAFPPATPPRVPPPRASGGALTVVRHAPDGRVPLAAELSVTFSEPMIAVSGHEDAARSVPVTLSPQPPGRWEWLGTRTIVFRPDQRFPQATSYRVEVPAGVRSAAGHGLARAVRFGFATPGPTMIEHVPGDVAERGNSIEPLDAEMLVRFDQRIEPAAMLAAITVRADGVPQAVRLLGADELTAALARRVTELRDDGAEGRWLAFRAVRPLPPRAAIDVAIAAGAPSAEGPDPSRERQHFGFATCGPLALATVSSRAFEALSGEALDIKFNNPLDAARFTADQVTVAPAIPGMKATVYDHTVVLHGATAPRTRYRVVVSGSVVDAFGQALGHDEPLVWQTGDVTTDLFAATGDIVLDPAAAQPSYDVFTVNVDRLRVQLYEVAPGDYAAYHAYFRADPGAAPPGRKRFDRAVATAGGHNSMVETHIDLRPALGVGDFGHVVAVVEPDAPVPPGHQPRRAIAWIQSTHLGIDARSDRDGVVARATRLDDGAPAAGVALELEPHGVAATTDERGLATLAFGRVPLGADARLVARDRGDMAMIPVFRPGDPVRDRPELAWYVFDDRGLYRPGEQVSFKGWLRSIDHGKHGDLGGVAGSVTSVAFAVTDHGGGQIAEGSATVNPAGGFDARFTVPATAQLGDATIELTALGRRSGRHRRWFQIEDYRRPDFEVALQPGSTPFLIGNINNVTARARYFSGGALPGAAVRWQVRAMPTWFTPPDRGDFVFGRWRPDWWSWGDWGGWGDRDDRAVHAEATHDGLTDASGAHTLRLDVASVRPAGPVELLVDTAIDDVNRQRHSASAAYILHPSSLYVGVKPERSFVDRGTAFDVAVIGVDLDGKPAVGAAIELGVVRLDRVQQHGEWLTRELEPQRCAVTAAAQPVRCSFATPTAGEYRLRATIIDARGRPNLTELVYWVGGGGEALPRRAGRDRVQVIPDRAEYAPGATAKLLIRAPFYPAEGVVTWRRSGIVNTETVALAGPTAEIAVPISDAMVPNLVVHVDLVGMAVRDDDRGVPDPDLPRRPAHAAGEVELGVLPTERRLQVALTPAATELAPRGHTQIAVAVRDARGRPVAGAEVAVVVVDEAVLALARYRIQDPIAAFYPWRGAEVHDATSRDYLVLPRPAPRWRIGSADSEGPLSDEELALLAEQEGKTEAITVTGSLIGRHPATQMPRAQALASIGAIRRRFDPLAVFAPALHTDAAGTARVAVSLPDSVTRYRVIAVAAAGDREFGERETAITARLPLTLRPSPPRFLRAGDRFELPVVVENQADAPATVAVAVRASNATLTAGAGREVTVPGHDRVELRFPAAAVLPGTARFQFAATTRGGVRDAAEIAVPVAAPATTESFASYGAIDGDAGALTQPVASPRAALAGFGGLEVTTSSTQLAALTDALLYLVRYPYECAEQRASRILAIASLADELAAFGSKDLPSRAELMATLDADVVALTRVQNQDGGFAFWQRGAPSLPFLSIHVASALGRARARGAGVPAAVLDPARDYLRDIADHIPRDHSVDAARAVRAYALAVRKQLGDADIAAGKQLLAEAGGPDHLPLEADGWLLALFARDPTAEAERRAIVRHALDRLTETAGAASFAAGYLDGAQLLLGSDRRVDAVMLDALIQDSPDLDAIPTLVTGLLAHRSAGRWLSTSENAFALAALDRYFRVYERAAPDFVARVWLGKDFAGDHAFRGHSAEHHHIDIAMADVAAHEGVQRGAPLTIGKAGAGRLYYRIAMSYALASPAAPVDHGFDVARRYEAIDDPGDVRRAADGSWHIRAGARVRVRVSLVNDSRRYHVALVDPLPAGFEILNRALATTEAIPDAPDDRRSDRNWYEHQNLRDDRAEAFTQLLWEGAHRYDYVARATTPGSFVVPAPTAEEMYMPETFGRGAGDRVVIE